MTANLEHVYPKQSSFFGACDDSKKKIYSPLFVCRESRHSSIGPQLPLPVPIIAAIIAAIALEREKAFHCFRTSLGGYSSCLESL